MEMLRHLVPALGPDVWRECLTSPALRRGDVAVCRFLVDHGVDINFAFGSGSDLGLCTPLHHAGTFARTPAHFCFGSFLTVCAVCAVCAVCVVCAVCAVCAV